MLELGIAFFIGLMVGWNVLPQPKWASALWAWFTSLISRS